MAHAILLRRRSATITSDGVVHIDGLEARDPEVASLIAESEDPDTVTVQALQIGARALRYAQGDEELPAA